MGIKGSRQTTKYKFVNGLRVRVLKNKPCFTCKNEFYVKYVGLKYCSRDCYYEMKRVRGDRAKLTIEGRLKLRQIKLGANNPQWRGGVTVGRVKMINTMEYKAWRKAVYTRDNYTCQQCGERGGKLNADHIIPWWRDEQRRLDVSNGQTLCEKCHREKTRVEHRMTWINQFGQSPARRNI